MVVGSKWRSLQLLFFGWCRRKGIKWLLMGVEDVSGFDILKINGSRLSVFY